MLPSYRYGPSQTLTPIHLCALFSSIASDAYERAPSSPPHYHLPSFRSLLFFASRGQENPDLSYVSIVFANFPSKNPAISINCFATLRITTPPFLYSLPCPPFSTRFSIGTRCIAINSVRLPRGCILFLCRPFLPPSSLAVIINGPFSSHPSSINEYMSLKVLMPGEGVDCCRSHRPAVIHLHRLETLRSFVLRSSFSLSVSLPLSFRLCLNRYIFA